MKTLGKNKFRPITTVIVLLTSANLTAESDLNGLHLNFVAFHNPPFDTWIQGSNGTSFPLGLSINIFTWLAKKYKFTISAIPVNQTLVNQLGTIEAVYYQLKNEKDVDGILGAFYLTMDRVERFDYTSFVWSESFHLIVPRPGEESRLFAFIGPFQPMVWMLVFISVFSVIGTMTFFTWFYNRHPTKNLSDPNVIDSESNQQLKNFASIRRSTFNFFGSHTIYIVNTMTNQGGREAFRRGSFRLLTGVWVLCAMVLVNSYTGIVTSSLTTPKMKPSIDTLEELAASKEIGVVLRSDVSTGVQILGATSGVYKILGDQARNNPDRIFVNPYKLAEKLETGHFAYPFLHTYTVSFVAAQYKKDRKCRFKISKQLPIASGVYSYFHKKGSWYTKTISGGITDLLETGLVPFWVNHLPNVPKADECFKENKRKVSRLAPIQLTDLTSAFLILGIGIGLATLVFLLETIYSKWDFCKHR